jgi:hypothetical protein
LPHAQFRFAPHNNVERGKQNDPKLPLRNKIKKRPVKIAQRELMACRWIWQYNQFAINDLVPLRAFGQREIIFVGDLVFVEKSNCHSSSSKVKIFQRLE